MNQEEQNMTRRNHSWRGWASCLFTTQSKHWSTKQGLWSVSETVLAMPCWWAPARVKQLSMAATARVIWLSACVRYWSYHRVGTCASEFTLRCLFTSLVGGFSSGSPGKQIIQMLVWWYVRAGLEPRTSGLRARYADRSIMHPPKKNIPTTLIWNKTKMRYDSGPKKPLNLVIVTLSVFVSSFLVKS